MADGSSINSIEDYMDLMGKTAVDKVTGYKGIVTCVTFDLYGCTQVVLTPPMKEDMTTNSGKYFDLNRINIMDNERVMPVPEFFSVGLKGPADKPVNDRM